MAGAESPDFSAIIMLCDSVACPEGKLYIQGGGWRPLPPDRYPVPTPRVGVPVRGAVAYPPALEHHRLALSSTTRGGRYPPYCGPYRPAQRARPPDVPLYPADRWPDDHPPLYLRLADSHLRTTPGDCDPRTVVEPDAYHLAERIDRAEIHRPAARPGL